MKTLKLTTNGIVTPKMDKPITKETIRANIGLLGLKGKHLKSLMIEKIKNGYCNYHLSAVPD